MTTLAPANKPIIIGKISGVFGVHGWVKVFSHTEPRNNILQYNPWLIKNKNGWQSVGFRKGREQGKTIVAQLEDVDSPEKAHALIGSEIAIDESQLKRLSNDDYYWRDLQGLKVVNLGGELLGSVSSMMATGANDVMVVGLTPELAQSKSVREILIPYIDGVIKKVSLENGLIEVDWDEDFD